MDIDIVYLWVNGSDPQWIAKRDAFIGKPSGQQENCKGRFADSGDLKYSLRSIERYAPWIRKVFIVTDNQVPEWLDITNSKVQIIDHTEIMPKESLPCYNSNVIQQFLYRIPGLSENFLYANDDMYINQPVTPATFFANDGLPYLYMNRKPFRKLWFWTRENILNKPLSQYLQVIRNTSRLVEKKYGRYYGCKLHHNIDAYTKNMFVVANQHFGEELKTMYTHHVRSSYDYQRCLFSYIAIEEGLGRLKYVSEKQSFRLHIHKRNYYYKYEQYKPLFFCMNDSEYASDEDRIFAIDYVKRLFSAKSQFEK